MTLLAFGGLVWGPEYSFVNFDDYDYVVDNPQVRAGLTFESLGWALTSYHHANWHPLTWISLQLDCQIYGLNPRGFHATNVLLHAANVVLLFWFLHRSTGAVWASAVAAALFAVHPLHVESVAWVTERKDVLSTFFWLGALLAYVRYAERPGLNRYLLVALCLALGLMCKAMVVTLPCVLLLLDYWPLERWSGAINANCNGGGSITAPRLSSLTVGQLVLEKVPLLLLSMGGAVLTVLSGMQTLADPHSHFSLNLRLMNAAVSYTTYLRQWVWPSDLSVLYFHSSEQELLPWSLLALLFLVAVTGLTLYWRQRRPYLVVGWLWYLGTLVPVIGFLQAGRQAHADRFAYVPLIGMYWAWTWAAAECLGRLWYGRAALIAAAAAVLAASTAVTWAQLEHWRSSASLWQRAAQVAGDDARVHFTAAGMFLRSKETDLAIHHAARMRQLAPDDAESHRVLAHALLSAARYDEALKCMAREAELRPAATDVRRAMWQILWMQGQIPAANEQLALIARSEPDSAEGQHYQGIMLHRAGQPADAARRIAEAIRLAPDNPQYHADLALALEDQGESAAAGAEYRTALAVNPEWADISAGLAWILATHPDAGRRDGVEAMRRARQACAMAGQRHPPFLRSLAAAYAEVGQFDRAMATIEEARQLAIAARESGFARRLDMELSFYRKKQPYRDDDKK